MRLKTTHFHAAATPNQAAKWAYWARRAGFHAVGAWLEALANRETKTREIEGGYRPPDSNGRV